MSVLFCMWILNAGLPEARLHVHDVIEAREQKILVDTIQQSVTIRDF